MQKLAIATGIVLFGAGLAPIVPPAENFAVAVFEDGAGHSIQVDIPDTQYAQMGGADGVTYNPVLDGFTFVAASKRVCGQARSVAARTLISATTTPTQVKELVAYEPTKCSWRSPIKTLTPEASAAIAFDSGNKYTACVTGTSCTYSFTNTAGNFLANGSISYTTNPGTVTMTYAGAAMTQAGTTQTTGGAYSYVFYKANPATGANNIVTTTTNSLTNGFYDHVSSYSGTDTTTPVANVVQETTGDVGNDSLAVTITTTSSSWALWWLGSVYGRTYSAGANTTERTGVADTQVGYFDSGGIASASPWTLNAVIDAATEPKINTGFELKAAAVAPAVDASYIIIFD